MPDRTFRTLAFVVIALAAAVYSNTLSYGSAWDDSRFVFASGATEGVSGIPSLFTTALLRDMPAGRGAYRPVTAVSYALDWTLGGGQASFFHKTNVLLHAAVTALVLALLLALGASRAGALVGAAVFAVHPVHVEAVASIAGRSELLAALFAVAAARVYVGPRSQAGERLGLGRAAAVLVLYGAAALSKEHAIALSAVFVMIEAFDPRREGSPVRRVLARWPFWLGVAAVALGYLALRSLVLGTLTTWDIAPYITVLPTGTRITSSIANWLVYARLHFFPADLSVDYGPALVLPTTVGGLRFWGGLGLGFSALAVGFAARRRHRLVPLGLAWFAFGMLPVANLVVPIAQWVAERFFYWPSVGFVMFIAAAVQWAPTRCDRRELRLIAGTGLLALVLLTGRTWTRNQTWSDTGTVLATLVTEHPESYRAQWFVSRLYFDQGRLDEAFALLDSATALNPNLMALPLERAEWLLRTGRFVEAQAVAEAMPAFRHSDREAHLVRAFLGQGRRAAADSALTAGRAAFPANAGLAALQDSIESLTRLPPDTIR